MIEVYTDGSCEKNPGGRGGWGWVVDSQTYGLGGDPSTTNQRMEVEACLQALTTLPTGDLTVVTDSMYLVNCATGKWKRKANTDLWARLDEALLVRKNVLTRFRWVKGHSGVRLNEVADRLAYCGMTGTTLEEYASPDPEPAKPKFSIPARFNGTCGFCFKPTIENVSQITNTEDYGWIHVECFGLDHSDELLVGEVCSSCFTQKPLSGICDNCD